MLALTLAAELEGITDLLPTDTEENPYSYTFKVQCTSCREVHPNLVSFTRFDEIEQPGSRGNANFVWKCRGCGRTHSATIATAPTAYKGQADPDAPKDSNTHREVARQNIIAIDCRGLDFIEFKADGPWQAKGLESGTKFEDIELGDGDWFDYDEKAGEEVSARDLKWEMLRA